MSSLIVKTVFRNAITRMDGGSNVLSSRTVDKSIQARYVMWLLSTAPAASMRPDAIHAVSEHVVFQNVLGRFGVMG